MSKDTINLSNGRELIAKSMGLEKTSRSWKVGAALFCNKLGLLQSRFVRRLFSITDENIEKIDKIYQGSVNTDLSKDEWPKIRGRWKLGLKLQLPSKDISKILPMKPKFNKDVIKSLLEKLEKPAVLLQDSMRLRTGPMIERLKELPQFEKGKLQIAGRKYEVVTADVYEFAKPKKPLVSCGASSSSVREMILFDPANSPKLNEIYSDFKKLAEEYEAKAGGKITPEALIKMVNLFMRERVFPNSDMRLVDDLVYGCSKDSNITKVDGQSCIPIDRFLEAQTGICRHHSLVAAYLMDSYIQEYSPFEGKAQIMRDNISGAGGGGGHAWVTLVCKNEKYYILDSLNNAYGDLEKDKDALNMFFGKDAVRHQIEKAKGLYERCFAK